ncbi:MAG: chorismate mutase [Bacteroidetes bacterium]|nr:MAG: chorismate mutase [Bacteroidota bacterium]TAF90637.1 MAG: chorismate mutase [Bacteroidota bacterium]
MLTSVAIQGYEGSFHHQAALLHFQEPIQVVPCNSFTQLAKTVSAKKPAVKWGLMAIENSIAGSILPNYELILQHNLTIYGEVFLEINQHLLVNTGTNLADIKEVHSHPMALLQCMQYLGKHHWKLVETDDTALSAKELAASHKFTRAVIASAAAAELYNLEIIAPNIHNSKQNYTRFLLVSAKPNLVHDASVNKASLYFTTHHQQGSLAKVLQALAQAKVNISKIQSFPIPEAPFTYGFHADVEFTQLSVFEKALEAVKEKVVALKVLGTYQKANVK